MNYTLRRDEIEDVDDDASTIIQDEEGTTVTSSVGYRLVYDRRDDLIEPTGGYILSFSQDFAGFGGDVRHVLSRARATYYYALTPEFVLSLGLRAGYIIGIGQDVRINNRFYLGGDSFRGFKTGGIGPRDLASEDEDALGGNFSYVGTAEISFPLGLPNEFGILGRVFTEAGSLIDTDHLAARKGADVVARGSLRLSAGAGLSWRSPLGPIRLDFAEALLKEDFDETEVFRFSFGTRF